MLATRFQTFLRPQLLRALPTSAPPFPCICHLNFISSPLLLHPSPTSTPFPQLQTRSYASKKKGGGGGKKGQSEAFEEDSEEPERVVKGKGVKKGKGGFASEEVANETSGYGSSGNGNGSFDAGRLEKGMDEAVDKLRVGLKAVVGRVGRVSPGELSSSN